MTDLFPHHIELCFTADDLDQPPAISRDNCLEIVASFCSFYKLNTPIAIDITIATPDQIASYNAQTRSIDRPTDVLSFPLDFVEVAAEGSAAVMAQMGDAHPYAHLGEVVLCQEVAKAQAAQYNNSLADEMCLLLVHSLFHLVGYDHIHEADAAIMQAQEDAFLTFYNQRIHRMQPLSFAHELCKGDQK